MVAVMVLAATRVEVESIRQKGEEMKASEIKEAAKKHQASIWPPNMYPASAVDGPMECFKVGANWSREYLRDRIKLAMGALWDEDEITGSLWLGSTAICLIKAALEIEPEVDAPIPFDGEGKI
jgi:hypothetical protein